jgi:hypothetical protein
MGRYLLLCSNHQLRGRQLEDVSLLGRDGINLVTSSGVRQFNNEEHPLYLDLAVFNFTEPCEDRPEFKERFFDFQNIPPNAPSTDIAFAIIAGFPSRDQIYEIEEKNHIGRRKRIVACRLENASTNNTELSLQALGPLGFDPDGMSGGSAFVVQRVENEFRAYFAGMVVTGGGGRFRIIKVGVIENFLRATIASGW